MKNASKLSEAGVTDRRFFLQACTAASLLPVCNGLIAPFAWGAPQEKAVLPAGASEDAVWNSCFVNCGSRCVLKCHTKEIDNKKVLFRITTDDAPTDEFGAHQNRACLRGRSARQRVYNPDRLLYPMKRVGKRGEGKFERMTWDEAIKAIGDKLKYTIDKYGNEAIYYQYGSGNNGYNFGGRNACHRFLRLIGGYLGYYGDYSTGQITQAFPYMFGGGYDRSLTREMGNAKLVVMFGYNPSETRMSGGGETYQYSEWIRRNNVRTIIVDPRYTDSALGKEAEWIPIRPATDAALVAGIAHVLITENLVDQKFLDEFCIGYDEKTLPASAPKNAHYKAYVLGQGDDGVAKTPEWAAAVTGIPAERIKKLAREIGTAKPVFITQGWGVQRHAAGEETCRAIAMLGLLTGNIGLPGTNTGEEPGNYSYGVSGYPAIANPVKKSISFFMWTDAVLRGQEMTAIADGVRGADKLDQSIKFIWNYAGNSLINQHSDTHGTHKILEDDTLCEFILVVDNHMTPSAKYADILLPDVTNFENDDIINGGYAVGEMGGAIFVSQAIKPLGECRTSYEFCKDLARYFGVEDKFTEGKKYDDWLNEAYAKMLEKDPKLPATLEEARKIGFIRRRAPAGTGIGLAKFRQDPKANPLKTPSGKVEIYSESLAKLSASWKLTPGDVIKSLPEYVATWEGAEDFETKKVYPLQLIGHHTKGRTHSTYHNVPWLRRVVTDAVWINPLDAEKRGVKDGDTVRVKSKRGELEILAKVTPRIMPGVVSMGQGAWVQFNDQGVDVGGNVNTLTSLRPSALAKANPQHTNLVEIRKVTG